MRLIKLLAGLALGTCLAGGPIAAGASELVINANTSDPIPRKGWETVIEMFKAENPSIEVKFNVYDHESYKKSIRNWLTAASPDVVFWFAGNRMRQFVKPGLLEDVSPLFTDEVKAAIGPVAIDLVSQDGKQYGVPYQYYQWGIYYRKDLLETAGITEFPKTWDGLLETCDKMNEKGLVPVTVGSKDLWPIAGWFDYIDLRLNGYDFHMQLMNGQVSYKDPRVAAVFEKWKELLDRQCFFKNHASSTWQESQALLFQGKAGMMLIGNFITQSVPPEAESAMEFAPFPIIDPAVVTGEDAPMETIHIPAKATNKEDAGKLLAFMLRADVQKSINDTMRLIPVNKDAEVADDRFLKAGEVLLESSPHLAQFFDRDTSEDLATGGMKGFQEFMINPSRVEKVTDDLERARKRIYGALE